MMSSRSSISVATAALFLTLALPHSLCARGVGVPLPGRVSAAASEEVRRLLELDAARTLARDGRLARQDLERVDLDVCVDPGRGWLSGSATLQFEATTTTLELFLNESLTVLSVSGPSDRPLGFEREGRRITVPIGASVDARTREITIVYEGLMRPTHGVVETGRGLAVLLGDDCWYPSSHATDRALVRAVVRHPGRYASVLSGSLAGMATPPATRPGPCAFGDVWEAGNVSPCALVVGRIESRWGVLGDVFTGAHRDTSSGEARVSRGGRRSPVDHQVKQPLRFLESCFGPYPMDWLHVVVVPHGQLGREAVSGPGLIVVEADEDDPACAADPDPDAYFMELARMWWDDAYDAGRVVADGLAAHMELEWLASVRGEEIASERKDHRRQQYMRALTDSGGAAPLSLCLGPDASQDERISLGRGGALMDICSAVLGRDDFCRAVRRVGEDAGSGDAGLGAFAREIEDALGDTVDWLLYEWVARGDLPVYALEYETRPARGGGYVITGTIRQPTEPFRTPVPLTIDLGGWIYDEWIAIESADQQFRLEAELEPQAVTVDAGNVLLRIDGEDRARVHHELGRRAADASRWTEAVDQFGAAVALDPDRSVYRSRYGLALVRVGRPGDGLRELLHAIELSPSNSDLLFTTGTLSARMGDHETAAEVLGRYVRMRPADPRGHVELAMSLIELGDLEQAMANLDRCPVGSDTTTTGQWLERYHIAVGRYSEARGETELAVAAYEAALDVNPVSDEARRRLAAVRQP